MTTKLVLRRDLADNFSATNGRMASIQFNCPSCQLLLKVPEHRGGTSVRCPGCKQTVGVPATSQQPAATPPLPAAPATPPATPPAPLNPAVTYPPPIQTAAGGSPPAPEMVQPAATGAATSGSAEEFSPPHKDEERIEKLGRRHRVSLHRSVIYTQGILLIIVAVLAFLVGLAMGGGDSETDDFATGTPARLEGQVRYQEGSDFGTPDPGAVVILLPLEKQPSEQFTIESLAPGDAAPGDDHPILQEIRRLGGDYIRTGRNGQFYLNVVKDAEYYLLAISHDRPSTVEANAHDMLQVEKYFTDGRQLIGQQSYRWSVETVQGQKKRIKIMFD